MTTALDVLNALRAIAIKEAQAAHIDAHDRTGDRNRALAAGRKKAYQEIVERIDQLMPSIGDPIPDDTGRNGRNGAPLRDL